MDHLVFGIVPVWVLWTAFCILVGGGGLILIGWGSADSRLLGFRSIEQRDNKHSP